nr:MAG TPA: hypothetical protein [Bacteriophage sp.]
MVLNHIMKILVSKKVGGRYLDMLQMVHIYQNIPAHCVKNLKV